MKSSLKIFGSALVVGLLVACGGGGGDSSHSVPAAAQPSPTAPSPGPTEVSPAPAPIKVALGTKSFGGQQVVTIQNAVAAPSEVSGTLVLPTTSAGTVTATPVNQTVILNRTADGKYFGVSAGDGSGTKLVDPTTVVKICASSAQVGYSFLPGQSSRACAAVDVTTDTVTLPNTCSRDGNLYTMHVADGSVYWFDWTSERKFTIPSDSMLPGVVQADGAHVVWNGYTGASVKVVKAGAGKANVTIDFGSNCVGQFGQMNDATGKSGRLVDMTVVDGETWLQFLYHSDKSGADGGDGWGSEPWVETASGYTVQPSVIGGYLDFNVGTGNYFVTIPDVPCGSAGNITAYRGTVQDDGTVPYDPGTSGTDDPLKRPFGLGWLPIQADPTEAQLYPLIQDPSVTASYDRTNFSLVIGNCN